MFVPSPVALLFFSVVLFVLVSFPVGLYICIVFGGSIVLSSRSICVYRWDMPSMTSTLFFLMGLFVLYALSDGALFFLLGLSIFALPSIMSPFPFLIGLFVFQMGGLVIPLGMCIFHNEYVTLWVFKKGECIFRHQLLDFLANLILKLYL